MYRPLNNHTVNAILIVLGVVAICWLMYLRIEWHDTKKDIDIYIKDSEAKIERAENNVIVWVIDHTGEKAELLYREKDSRMYIVKSDSNIYKLKYNFDSESIQYVIHKDDIIYDRDLH